VWGRQLRGLWGVLEWKSVPTRGTPADTDLNLLLYLEVMEFPSRNCVLLQLAPDVRLIRHNHLHRPS
jgi:hypothetical protein